MAFPGGSIGTCFVELDLDPSRYMKASQTLLKEAQNGAAILEKNFSNLGIKSDAMYDLQRAQAVKSYEAIANSAKSTAHDILRAEEAKNTKLMALNEQQFGHQKSLLDKLKEHWIAIAGTIYAAMKFERMIEGWVKLAIAQDQADRSLKAAMISNNRYSEAFYKSTLAQASALQKLTGIEDDEIERGQKMLMMYSAIGNDVMPRVTKAMVNLAALMGGDVRTAALQLGKAMEGQAEALRRSGIIIDENVYKQRGAIGVLEEVEKKVTGHAEALAAGSGQWKLLGAALGEVKEGLGAVFTEMSTNSGILSKTIELFNKLGDALKDAGSDNAAKELRRNLSELVEAQRSLRQSEGLQSVFNLFGGWKKFDDEVQGYKTKIEELKEKIIQTPSFSEILFKQTREMTWEEQIAKLNIPKIHELTTEVKTLATEEKEAAKALEQLNDIIAKQTLDPYQLAVYDLDKTFKNLRDTLGNTPDVIRAYGLALDELKKKYLLTDEIIAFKKALGEIEWGLLSKGTLIPPSNLRDQLFNKSAPFGQPYQNIWENLKFPGFSTNLIPNQAILDEANLKRIIELEEAQFEGLQKELAEDYEYFSKLQIKQAEESRKVWDDTASSLDSSFMNAFDNIHKKGLGAFKNLGAEVTDILIHAINQQILAKPIKELTTGIADMFTSQQVITGYDPLYGMPIFGTKKGPLAGAAPYLGAASAGYGAYQQYQAGTMTPMSGAMSGAMIGSMFGPAGTIVGGVVGAVAGAIIGKAGERLEQEEKIPSVTILWEVIDNKIKKIADTWNNSPKSQALIDEIEKSLQTQIDFARQVSMAAGAKLINYGFSSSSPDLRSVGATGGIVEQTVAGYSSYISVFGQQFIKDFYTELLGTIGGGINQAAYIVDWERIISWMQAPKTSTGEEMTETAFGEKISDQWRLTYYQDIIAAYKEAYLFTQDTTGFEKWIATLEDKFEQITGFFKPAIGNALVDGLTAGIDGLSVFQDKLRAGLASTITASIIQGFMNSAIMPVILKVFGEQSDAGGIITRPSLVDTLTGYQTGTISLDQAMINITSMGIDLDAAMTTLAPLFPTLGTALNNISTALGVNTAATQSNTDALIGPVEAFLRDLQVGQFAPIQSLEAMKTTYEQLLADAIANPSNFSTFAGFAQSDYIPFGREISPDYSQFIGGIKSDVMDIPWYASKVAAPGSSPSAAEIGNAVAAAVSPLLIGEQTEIHIHLNINGREIATEVLNEVENSVQLTRKLSRAIR